jgi:Tol biopolymer transport system component
VAFAWNGEQRKNFDIYMKDISSPSPPLRITTSEEVDYSPAWSPDGRWIAFCRGTGAAGGGIWLIHPLGGPERKLVGLNSTAVPSSRDLAWSQDSKFLIVTSRLSTSSQYGISTINVESGEAKSLLAASAGEEYMFPAVSPDGRTVAFTRDTGPGISSILLFSLASGGPPRVLRAEAAGRENFRGLLNWYPAWTPDGRYIVFSSDSGGRYHLWLAPSDADGPLEELDALGDGLTGASISRTGQLAFIHQEYDTNIWRLDLHRQISAPGPNPSQVIASTRIENNPAVSPDGRRLAFSSTQSGYAEIWIADVDGKNSAPLTSMNNSITGSPDWSPDGRRIAFDSRAEGHPNVYVVDAGGGKPMRLTSNGSPGVVPRWSADGRWIYYSSDSSGRMEVWRVASSGGMPEQITRQGGFAAIASPDGKYLYFTSDNASASSLWEMEVSSGKSVLVASSVLNRGFALASSGLYFIQGPLEAEEHSLFLYDHNSRKATLLFQLQHGMERGISLTSDARSLYYTGIDHTGHELQIVNRFWH